MTCTLSPSLPAFHPSSFSLLTATVHNYSHTHSRLTALCRGLPGWAGTRRNIHPLTPILIIGHPFARNDLCCVGWGVKLYSNQILHLLRSLTSSLFNLRAWQSFSTTSLQVLFDLALSLGSSTFYSMHFFIQSSYSVRNTCPAHHQNYSTDTYIHIWHWR